MRKQILLLGICAVVPLLAQNSRTDSPADEHNKRIREATTVIQEMMGAGDKGIPDDLLDKAQCVGVVPNLKRVGFVVGAKYGKGVLACRQAAAPGWTALSTIRVEGGSVGFQIGAGETDLIFIVMNKSGMDRLMQTKFTVGGDASAMAGPIGRSAEARTDAMMKAEILSYSRSRGVFAGISPRVPRCGLMTRTTRKFTGML